MKVEKNETPLETKRIPDLDSDDTLTRVGFNIPKKWYKRLGEIAVEKEVSRGMLVREALRDWFKTQENPIESNPNAKITDEDLTAIIEHCTTFFGGFNIDGDGFIQTMLENDLKLKDLTQDQWETVLEYIALGYKGYFEPPEQAEWIAKFEPLEPTKQQLKDLSLEETESEEETLEPEEESEVSEEVEK